jgi:putative transposase
MNGTLRRICRNVKRWRGQNMIRRWIALGIAEAQKHFRRVKGHQQMPGCRRTAGRARCSARRYAPVG